MFRQNSAAKFKWDMIIIILAIFNSISLPFTLAFIAEEGVLYRILNILIDLFFVIDILINFRTSFIQPTTGDEIFQFKLIMLNYVSAARFWTDVLSIFPFDQLGFEGSLKEFVSLLGMFKVVRVTRINQIIANLNVGTELKAVIKVVNLVF